VLCAAISLASAAEMRFVPPGRRRLHNAAADRYSGHRDGVDFGFTGHGHRLVARRTIGLASDAGFRVGSLRAPAAARRARQEVRKWSRVDSCDPASSERERARRRRRD